MHFLDLRKVHKRMRCFIHFALLSFYILSYPDTSNAQKTGAVLIVSSAEHYRLGLGYAQKGDYKSAENAYKKALEMDANNIGPRDGLGFIYALQKKFTEATAEFEKVLLINPHYTPTLYKLGKIFFIQKI